MNENENRKTTTDVVFGKTVCTVPRSVSTQSVNKPVDSWDEVYDCILDMFDDDDQFVTLTLAEIPFHVRYIQAVRSGSSSAIIVQAGIEDEEHTRLVEKECTEDQCLHIFREFYDSANVQNLDEYTPVEFFI